MTLDLNKLPQHIAIIMDGNGRWAHQRNYPRIEGHRRGADRVDEIVTACRDLGVRYLTLYAFSMENWNRPNDEIRSLMRLLKHFLIFKRRKLIKNNVRLVSIGDIERLPKDVQQVLSQTQQETASQDGMILNLALSYGGRDEIVRAINQVFKEKNNGSFRDNFISIEDFSKYLDTAGMPEPDLLIRTSGERRVSNFLLWQLAYTEYYFTDTLWPDFSKDKLLQAIREFQGRERRFGKTSEQLHVV